MLKLTFVAIVGAAALATSAFAAPGSTVITASTSGAALAPSAAMQVEYAPQSKYPMGADEFQYVGGRYSLDNGATLSVTRTQSRFFAEIDGQPKSEVIAVAHNVFMARDNTIRMVFEPHESGFSTDVTVRYAVNK